MRSIKREDIPKWCPNCQSDLRSRHSPNGITELLCIVDCIQYKIIVRIDHNAETKGDTDAIILY